MPDTPGARHGADPDLADTRVRRDLVSAALEVRQREGWVSEVRGRLAESRERRRAAVVAARAAGASYTEIGELLGVSPQRARAIAADAVFAARRRAASPNEL